MVLYLAALISLGLTALAYAVKRTTIALGAAFGWLLFSLQAYDTHVVVWDIYYCAFWFGIAMMLGIAIESVGMKIWATFGREQGEQGEKESSNNHKRKKEAPTTNIYIHPSDKIRAKHGLPPSEARERRANNRRFYGN